MKIEDLIKKLNVLKENNEDEFNRVLNKLMIENPSVFEQIKPAFLDDLSEDKLTRPLELVAEVKKEEIKKSNKKNYIIFSVIFLIIIIILTIVLIF